MQPIIPGLEDALEAFMGTDSWWGLVEAARQLAEASGTFTVDDLTYTGEADQRIKGAALAYLRSTGEIEPVSYTRTIKPTSHGRPIVRWKRREV